ncbi:MAG: hypothetical protein R2838_14090 [Caldilineaceae bacterium]
MGDETHGRMTPDGAWAALDDERQMWVTDRGGHMNITVRVGLSTCGRAAGQAVFNAGRPGARARCR